MTRLTTHMRNVFVQAVMQDVPEGINYDEKAHMFVKKWACNRMSPKVLALYQQMPEWFKTEMISMPGCIQSINVPTNLSYNELNFAMKSDREAWSTLTEMSWSKHNQRKELAALKDKISAAIGMCTTVKSAHDKLPEFAKYLPALSAPIDRSVPVIANLVSDLNKAGWPADRKAA
jgi:hypothetical protein